jgi:hypothetical protein
MSKVPRGPAASAQTAGRRARTRSETGEVPWTARQHQRPNARTVQATPELDEVIPCTRGNASATCATTRGADIRTGTPVTAVGPDGQNATADDNVSTTYGKSYGLVSAPR